MTSLLAYVRDMSKEHNVATTTNVTLALLAVRSQLMVYNPKYALNRLQLLVLDAKLMKIALPVLLVISIMGLGRAYHTFL